METIKRWMGGETMEDHLFNLKFTAKQLTRESKKCEQNAAANKLKCKKAMEVSIIIRDTYIYHTCLTSMQ